VNDYPPPRHVLRDLALEVDRSGGGLVVRIPVRPELCGDRGALRAGVLGIAVDVFGGSLAIEAVAPDWSVTQDMQLHRLRPVARGPLLVSGEALRAGRSSVVVEVELRDGDPAAAPAAVGAMTFARLARRDDTPELRREPGDLLRFATADSGMDAPFLERIGLREGPGGSVELDLDPYVRNSLGALQGGVVTALVEVAAERAARRATGLPLVTTDFAVHFLALGRTGPLRASARLLGAVDGRATLRVELRDAGRDERLLAVAIATAGELGA
jgi:acyl-coenzyme A thioesterase PaaI-like protein